MNIFHLAGEKITNYLVSQGTISKDEFPLYVYCFETLLSQISFVAICITLSILLSEVVAGAVFIVCFTVLRMYAGGVHTSGYFSCFLISILLFTVGAWGHNFIKMPVPTMVALFVVSAVSICLLSPVQDSNKPLEEWERPILKKKTIAIVGAISVLYGIFLLLNIYSIQFSLTFLAVACMCMQVLGLIKNHYERKRAEAS